MNQCNFIGTLGRDAEVKQVNEKSVINFSIAVNEGYGENKTTLWIDCAKWGDKTAVAQYLKKGTKVAVSGSISLRSYTGKDGTAKSTLTIRCNDIELLGSKQEAEPSAADLNQSNSEPHTVGAEPNPDLPF